jgi:hypothetical protein
VAHGRRAIAGGRGRPDLAKSEDVMSRGWSRFLSAMLLGVCAAVWPVAGAAQPVAPPRAEQPPPAAEPAAPGGPRLPAERLTPVEVVRLFDAYAVVQAQEALGLDTQAYGAFVANYKALQDARRRHQEARLKLVQELNRLSRPREGAFDEAALRDRLKALADQETTGAAEIRRALDAVEGGLSVVQRARFKVFEEQMERRKFELLSRARQARPMRRGLR